MTRLGGLLPGSDKGLPEVPKSELDRASVIGSAVDVCLMLLLAILLNVFPQWVGVVMVTDGSGNTAGTRLRYAWYSSPSVSGHSTSTPTKTQPMNRSGRID